jgi:hypothetical protein
MMAEVSASNIEILHHGFSKELDYASSAKNIPVLN